MLVPVLTPGEVPADLVHRMQERYGQGREADGQEAEPKDSAWTRPRSPSSTPTATACWTSKELAGFVKRPPDLELVLRLAARRRPGHAWRSSRARASRPLADKLQTEGRRWRCSTWA